MQYDLSVISLIAFSIISSQSALGAYVPSEPWSTLTPSSAAPSGATTDYSQSFAIAISPITSSVPGVSSSAIANASTASAAVLNKRGIVSQIGDGQVQATTGTDKATTKATDTAATTAATQQTPKVTTTKLTSTKDSDKKTAELVSQIGDGQIQGTTNTKTTQQTEAAKKTAALVSQIGDGQVQATTGTEAAKKTANLVSQIGDGQVQATTGTDAAKKTANLVSQIGDGQVQATTGTEAAKKTANLASQISDGQVQATTATGKTQATAAAASQVSDGQVQNSGVSEADLPDDITEVACASSDTLTLTLKNSILTDSKQRIGSIVANHQFQFDATPQAGAIYAAGWSISDDGILAIGDNTVFYQCLSGTFYNLYDENIGSQCTAVHLTVVGLIDC